MWEKGLEMLEVVVHDEDEAHMLVIGGRLPGSDVCEHLGRQGEVQRSLSRHGQRRGL
jgi:hypothetical protein